MKTWFRLGVYLCTSALMIDIYFHQLGLALLMAICLLVNITRLKQLEEQDDHKDDNQTLQ